MTRSLRQEACLGFDRRWGAHAAACPVGMRMCSHRSARARKEPSESYELSHCCGRVATGSPTFEKWPEKRRHLCACADASPPVRKSSKVSPGIARTSVQERTDRHIRTLACPLLRGCINAAPAVAAFPANAYRIQYARNFLALGCKGEGDGPPPVAPRGRGFRLTREKRISHDYPHHRLCIVPCARQALSS